MKAFLYYLTFSYKNTTLTSRFTKTVSVLSIIGLTTWLLLSCSFVNLQDHGTDSRARVQLAVDGIRANLEKDLRNQVPSLNVFIQTPTEKIFVSSGGTPITESTYFRFASNTKNFTSTAILNMYEDGWLDYKAHITDLIPGTATPYVPNTADWNFPYKNSITIEQLLQHSAGVFDVDNDTVPGFKGMSFTEYTQTIDPTHQFTADEMIHQLVANNLSYFAPGTGYHYSNTGYAILGEIIERVYSAKSGSAKTYKDYLETYVTGPTAPVPLDVIHFPVRADDTILPLPHVEGMVLSPGKIEKYSNYNMSGQVAEGNGYGTMAALHTYIRTLMKAENVLKPETVKLMQADVSSANPTYGLGCSFTASGYGHNGARIGYLSQMAYDPATDVSVVVLLPIWDLTQGNDSFLKCFNALNDAAKEARIALGYK